MRFSFDKAACQNIRRALRKEWLLTNGLGDYASSSILCCNTRKYHGLLTVNTPHGRHVLLSTLEESVRGGGKEFFLSTRQHPKALYPDGHEYLESFRLDQWPEFTYRVGDAHLRREMFLQRGKSRLVLRYSLKSRSELPPLTLRLKPLLAYRHFHALTHANPQLRASVETVPHGFKIEPYDGLPALFFQVRGANLPLPPRRTGFTMWNISRKKNAVSRTAKIFSSPASWTSLCRRCPRAAASTWPWAPSLPRKTWKSCGKRKAGPAPARTRRAAA